MNEIYKSACEQLGWKIFYFDDDISLEKEIHDGRIFRLRLKLKKAVRSFDDEGFVEGILDYYAGFDDEKYIMEEIERKQNGNKDIPSVRQLVKEADEIEGQLQKLVRAVADVRANEKAEFYARIENHIFKASSSVNEKHSIIIFADNLEKAGEKAKKYFGSPYIKVSVLFSVEPQIFEID